MRDPFNLPENCNVTDFALPLFTAPLPYCSLPPFSDSTRIIPSAQFTLPFAPPPWNCVMIPSHSDSTYAAPDMDVSRMFFSIRIHQSNEDACDPSLYLSVETELPCLPLTVKHTGGITWGGTGGSEGEVDASLFVRKTPVIDIAFSRVPDCALSFEANIEIPCIGFKPSITFTTETISMLSAPIVSARMRVNGDDCEVHTSLHIQFPEIPGCIGFTPSVHVSVLHDTDATFPIVSGTMEVDPSNCALDLGLRFNFPTPPGCIGFTPSVHVSVLHDTESTFPVVSGTMLVNSGDCEMDLGLRFNFPAPPGCIEFTPSLHISVDHTAAGTYPTVSGSIYTDPDNCKLDLALKFNFPSGPDVSCIGFTPSMHLTIWQADGTYPTITGGVTVTGCSLVMSIGIGIPNFLNVSGISGSFNYMSDIKFESMYLKKRLHAFKFSNGIAIEHISYGWVNVIQGGSCATT